MKTKPVARFRLRLSVGERVAIGPGKVELLEAIRDRGSLSSAAAALGISYRRAWTMLDELSSALKRPAVETATGGTQGGGTRLTPTGTDIIERYRRIERVAAQACDADLKALARLLQR